MPFSSHNKAEAASRLTGEGALGRLELKPSYQAPFKHRCEVPDVLLPRLGRHINVIQIHGQVFITLPHVF